MAEAGTDPGARGRLDISPRAVQSVAEGAAREVAGTTRHDPTLGRHLPRATVDLSGSEARVRLVAAVLWDRPLPIVAAQLRDHVHQTVGRLTGLSVATVDVDLATLDEPDAEPATAKRTLR